MDVYAVVVNHNQIAVQSQFSTLLCLLTIDNYPMENIFSRDLSNVRTPLLSMKTLAYV